MSTTTAVRVGDLPRVNLLPPEIHERKKVRAAQAGAALAIAAAIAGVAVGYVRAGHSVDAAKADLASKQQQQTVLTQRLSKLTDVRTTASLLAANEALMSRAMATEVEWSTYLQDFTAIIPNTTWLTQLTMSSSLAPGSLVSPSQAPARTGTITFQGDTLKWPTLADLLDSLAKEKGLSNVYFSTATEQYIGPTKIVNFQASSDLNPSALSGRCADSGSC